jgi:HPt (histidine-containing phosphotransfer) domain-containing protein
VDGVSDNQAVQAVLNDIDLASAQVLSDFEGYPEVLAAVAQIFRECYPDDLKALRAAVNARDSATVAFIAHKIRGSVLCFHHEDVARIAATLECQAQHNDFQGTDTLLESLVQAYGLVCSTLERAERLLV